MLTEGLVGWVCIAPEGLGTSGSPGKMDEWPVRIGSCAPTRDLEAIATYDVQFYVYQAPNYGVTIPTA